MGIRTASSFDVLRPGTWVAGDERDWADETQRLLSLIQHEFERAVACWAAYCPLRVDPQVGLDIGRHAKALREVYAREFVLALDSISKLLSKLPKPPDEVVRLQREYWHRFGDAKHIRDSFAHIEDRGRGRRQGGEPVQSPLVVLACFVGDRFEFTASNGNRYGIEVSAGTLTLAHELVQGIIGCYKWE